MSYKIPCVRCGKKIVYRERNILTLNKLIREELSESSTNTLNAKVVYERRDRSSYAICDDCLEDVVAFVEGEGR